MEAAHGATKTVTFQHKETCPDCHGSGAKPGSNVQICPDCHGSGYVTVQQRTAFGVMQNTRVCTKCGGKGKIVTDPCGKCRGTGYVNVTVKNGTDTVPAVFEHKDIQLPATHKCIGAFDIYYV